MSFKVMIAYPPIPSDKGVPLISQNRQFQWFNRPTFIYPVVPAYAATLLQDRGYQAVWADGVAAQMTVDQFKELVDREQPDMIAIEAKTPVIRPYWKWVNELKRMLPNAKLVLMGDHVTAFPDEGFDNSQVDYCLAGGDFDWALLNLANHLTKGEALEGGVHWRDAQTGQVANSGAFKLEHDLNLNPFIDRDLTQWERYAFENGNFKYTPGTYQMAGRDCWWGKCTFCSWTTTFNNFRSVTPERHLAEVEQLVKRYGVREIFDDTGTFPAGLWLKKFTEGLVETGLSKKVTYGCNMKRRAEAGAMGPHGQGQLPLRALRRGVGQPEHDRQAIEGREGGGHPQYHAHVQEGRHGAPRDLHGRLSLGRLPGGQEHHRPMQGAF
jgi:radical SAM superfamily enzyme YgiQ (UPF0313 family)